MRATYSQNNGLTLELTPSELEQWQGETDPAGPRYPMGSRIEEVILVALFHGRGFDAEDPLAALGHAEEQRRRSDLALGQMREGLRHLVGIEHDQIGHNLPFNS